MRYRVTITDFGPACEGGYADVRIVRRVSLGRAQRIATRALRRGQRLYGSAARFDGMWGGTRGSYAPNTGRRHATIEIDRATASQGD